MKAVSEWYIEGITDARRDFGEHGIAIASDRLESLARLCKQFDASNPVGQMFRGERDFWRNKVKNA